MREKFSVADVVVAVLTAAAITRIFASQAVSAAEFPTSASANACAQWNLSAADFNECQSLWSAARTSGDRKEIEKRFQARGMIIPGSRRTPVNSAGDSDAAARGANPPGARNAEPASTGGASPPK